MPIDRPLGKAILDAVVGSGGTRMDKLGRFNNHNELVV
jgi:hypothetical protein